MTNLEAISSACNYPIDELKLKKILIDQGIDYGGIYTGLSKAFELATAALYVLIVTSANLSEGDFQISATDKSNLIELAGGIYNKYGIANPLKSSNTVRNRSNYW